MTELVPLHHPHSGYKAHSGAQSVALHSCRVLFDTTNCCQYYYYVFILIVGLNTADSVFHSPPSSSSLPTPPLRSNSLRIKCFRDITLQLVNFSDLKIPPGQPVVVEMREDNNEGDIDHEGCPEGETG